MQMGSPELAFTNKPYEDSYNIHVVWSPSDSFMLPLNSSLINLR
jgi:hypothetical protein